MDFDVFRVPLDCWIQIFSFLQDDDLNRASCVCKVWWEAAATPWLWRKMCLQQWSFCNVASLLNDTDCLTWKNYYMRRTQLERKMKSGRPCGDYTCKSLRGHTGRVVGVVYVAGNNSFSEVLNSTPVVCSASTDGTVRGWDIQKGVQLWSTPAANPLWSIAAYPQKCLAITADTAGDLKIWEGLTGQQVATFPTASHQCELLPFSYNGDSFLLIGTSQGSLIVLTIPSLTKLSSQVIIDTFKVNLLLSSTDEKWIFVASKENIDFNPKVFFTKSLCCANEEEGTLSVSLPVSSCCAAAFFPGQPARVAVIHGGNNLNSKILSVFDISMKKSKYDELLPNAQPVESFALGLTRSNSDLILHTKGNSTIVVADANHLKVYTMKGALIATFKDHTLPITSLCMDGFRVVTASQDLSLRVLTWRREKDKGLTLESQYHLLGGSHTMSRGFTHVTCDYASIVASVEAVNGKDVLKAYTFDS
ncbi:F-box/WD repeat-containing protein 12 [Chanos chanos]|uniref:F-box/WD repeat-containing protein 12 n=1 Tax=Chanos chanos TaxID=29144 RepID=A0A6J2V0Z7_CHACN|nr:F-box/WD repeat-containing protein 12 [Chanos chanos]